MRTTTDRPRSTEIPETLPNHMHAIRYQKYGSPEVLTFGEAPVPQVRDKDVLVRVHATAVSPADWFGVRGWPYIMRLGTGLRSPRRQILGFVVAGTVVAVGSKITHFQPGDEVYGEAVGGTFAQFARCKEDRLATKPPSLTFEQSAAVPLVGVTALEAMRDKGEVQPGDRVLINGASGGVGTFAVQIAKHLGADVTAVCSSNNTGLVRSLGADATIDYTQEDFTEGGPRYDVILDNVGNHSLNACRRALVPGGIYLPSSAAGGKWIGGLARAIKSVLLSPFVRDRLRPFLSVGRTEHLETLAEMIEAGQLIPIIDRTYGLERAADAIRHYADGHARGKVIISVG